MPTIDRTTITRDPALITYDGATFFSQGDITLVLRAPTNPIVTSLQGTVDDTRVIDRMFEIQFTPAGEFEGTGVLFGGLAVAFGASVVGATDKPLVIHTQSGQKYTFASAFITVPPEIRLSTRQTIFGAVTMMALVGSDADPSSIASYYAVTSEAFPGYAAFDPTAIKTLAYSAAWGSSPWDDFAAAEGFVVRPQLQLEPEVIDGVGTIDYKLRDATVDVVAQPVGPTAAQVLAKLPQGAALGASRLSGATNLEISATGVFIRVHKALMVDADLGFGQRRVVGNCTWRATRAFTAGVADPLLTVATADPDA